MSNKGWTVVGAKGVHKAASTPATTPATTTTTTATSPAATTATTATTTTKAPTPSATLTTAATTTTKAPTPTTPTTTTATTNGKGTPNPKKTPEKPQPPQKKPAAPKAPRTKAHFYSITPSDVTDKPPNVIPRNKAVYKELVPTSLGEIAAKKFKDTFEANPKENIPALLSLPPAQFKYIMSHLSPYNVEAWVQLFEYQQQHPKHHFLSLKDLIYLIQDQEEEYVRQKHTKTPSSSDPKLERNLIDVWENYDSFMLKPVTEEEKKIFCLYYGKPAYRPSVGDAPEHSVADAATFKKRFSVFTSGLFDGWKEWDNMVVIGGAVQACLSHVPEKFENDLAKWYHEIAYKTSDIDVYFYGMTAKQFQIKLYNLYEHLCRNNRDVLVIRTPYTVTFATKWPRRHIQVVLSAWGSVQDILMEADVDPSGVAFDGKKLWTTQRGRFSYNYRCIVPSSKSYCIRGAFNYESRLIKYSRRGFYIWDPEFSWDLISDRMLQSGVQRMSRPLKRAGVYGLRLLLIGVKYLDKVGDDCKKFFEDTDRRYKDQGLAYGPKWPNSRLRPHVEGLTVPTDYGPVPSDYKVIKVKDVGSIFNLSKDKLRPSAELSRPQWLSTLWYSHLLLEDDKNEIAEAYNSDDVWRVYYYMREDDIRKCCEVSPSYCLLTPRVHIDRKNFYCKDCFKKEEDKGLTPDHFVYKLAIRKRKVASSE